MRTRLLLVICLALLLGLLPTAAGAATPAGKAGGFWHRIQWGETINSIARRYGVPADAIVATNGLASANRIYAGTWLWIPSETHPPTPPPGPTCVAKVTVRKGDTLAKIGARYAVAPLKIARANYLANPNLIYPGQRLCIPFRGVPRGSTIP